MSVETVGGPGTCGFSHVSREAEGVRRGAGGVSGKVNTHETEAESAGQEAAAGRPLTGEDGDAGTSDGNPAPSSCARSHPSPPPWAPPPLPGQQQRRQGKPDPLRSHAQGSLATPRVRCRQCLEASRGSV